MINLKQAFITLNSNIKMKNLSFDEMSTIFAENEIKHGLNGLSSGDKKAPL